MHMYLANSGHVHVEEILNFCGWTICHSQHILAEEIYICILLRATDIKKKKKLKLTPFPVFTCTTESHQGLLDHSCNKYCNLISSQQVL